MRCKWFLDAALLGDRHFKKANKKGQNITFIEAEAVDEYNQLLGQAISPQQTRRNVITRGVDLSALVGVEFSIGDAKFRGVELCQPCSVLGSTIRKSEDFKEPSHPSLYR